MHVLLAFTFDQLTNWLSVGGYPVLFGILFACGLGLPVPEDIPLIIAGALVSQGKMHFALAAVCAWCGIVGGDIMLYNIARKFGREITRLPLIGTHVTIARLDSVGEKFEKYGVGVVAVGRLFAGIRGAMVITAGATRFNFWKFLIADSLAAIFSGGLFMLLGHWIGERLSDPETQHFIHKFKEWFAIGGTLLALVLIVYILWHRKHKNVVMRIEEKTVEKLNEAAQKVVHPLRKPETPDVDPSAQQS